MDDKLEFCTTDVGDKISRICHQHISSRKFRLQHWCSQSTSFTLKEIVYETLTKSLIGWAVKRNVSKRGNYLNYLISWTLFDIFTLIIISIFANTSPISTNPLSIITLIQIKVTNQLETFGKGHLVTWH